ncbi:GRIN3 protein, partial [Nothoprocta ornata]|nr:GRIN3 protein [Nothoprocta ornata]
MGTVPDALRSAKLSLVAASEEKDHVGDLQPAKPQHKQPSGAAASNGFPPAVSRSAGVCSLDLKCPPAANAQTCEKRPGDDARCPGTLSPGLLGKASEGCPAGVEPAGNAQPRGSEGPGPAAMPAPQDARPLAQSGQGSSSNLAQGAEAALKPQGTGDQPVLGVLGCSAPSSPVSDNESSHVPQANVLQSGGKEKGGEKAGPAACQTASAVGDTGGDAGRAPRDALETECGAAGTVQSGPADGSATAQGSDPQPTCGAGLSQPASFRDTGTMTAHTENSPSTREAAARTWRDAEVQAVASVESKSACTSPSILSAFLKKNPPLEEKEELHIVCQGSGGLSQAQLSGSLSSHPESLCSSGTVSEPTVVTAVNNTAQTQAVKLQKHPGDPAVSAASADNTAPALPGPPAAIASPGPSMAGGSRDAAPALPEATAADPPAGRAAHPRPSQPGCHEASAAPAAAGLGMGSDAQRLAWDAGSPREPLPGTAAHRGIQQKEVPGSAEQKPGQGEGGNKANAIPVVKAKEENVTVLDPEGAMNVSGERAAVGVKGSSEDAGEKGCDAEPGGMSRALQSGGRGSARAAPLAEASAAPPQQQGLQDEEPGRDLETAAPPASAQALPSPTESSRQPGPATEAKVQVKQSKHVRDVVWDEQGMTWEVYGASLDPESLGIAIQNHLQRQIREHEKLIRAQNTQNRKSISSDTSSNKKLKGRQHNVFQSMLQNFRRPNCCVRPAPSSVLD